MLSVIDLADLWGLHKLHYVIILIAMQERLKNSQYLQLRLAEAVDQIRTHTDRVKWKSVMNFSTLSSWRDE